MGDLIDAEVPLCGSVKLYHPKGVVVSLPVPLSPRAAYDYAGALRAVDAALAAGWLVAPVGLEAGEEREMVGFVVRTSHAGKGGVVPVVDLYDTHSNHVKPFLRVYLDTADDVAAFEFASGLILNEMPEYVGEGRVERGKPLTARFVVAPPRAFGVVFKPNPAFDPEETDVSKKKPKRLFERWVDRMPATTPSPSQRAGGDEADHTVEDAQRKFDAAIDLARKRIAAGTSVADLLAIWADTPPAVRDVVLPDFTARKIALTPPDRPTLLARINEAAKELKQTPTELIHRFAIALKLDEKRLPALTNLTDAQLVALCRLATHQAQLAVVGH